MRSFSAQYVFTNTSAPLKRGIVTTDNHGNILTVEDTKGQLSERRSVEFFDGIIIPGFVNCHCHLELSHMKGLISRGTGLGDFVMQIRLSREKTIQEIASSAAVADQEMLDEGIVLCADICNTSDTFNLKKKSNIPYKNLLEVFGLNPDKAGKRIEEIKIVAQAALSLDLPFSIVPHSTYSLSVPLFRLVKELGETNEITSIHFLETESEREFLENRSGELMDSYIRSGIVSSVIETAENPVNAIINTVTRSGNLLLVHNTFARREDVRALKSRGRSFWCLCPGSNMYITGKVPPADMLLEEGCDIVIGTDSLASNHRLSILEEIKVLQASFPSLTLEKLISWSTLNGARALNEEGLFGSIEPGKKPGILLLQNADIINMKLLPETTVKRLI